MSFSHDHKFLLVVLITVYNGYPSSPLRADGPFMDADEGGREGVVPPSHIPEEQDCKATDALLTYCEHHLELKYRRCPFQCMLLINTVLCCQHSSTTRSYSYGLLKTTPPDDTMYGGQHSVAKACKDSKWLGDVSDAFWNITYVRH